MTDAADPQAVIHLAVKKGILREPTLGLVAELKRHWTVAVSTEPLSPDAANRVPERRAAHPLGHPREGSFVGRRGSNEGGF